MKIGIIGYDLFGTGGTKQSNINLINELTKEGHEIYYFNLLPFSKRSLKKTKKELKSNNVLYSTLDSFSTSERCDVYIITRESLFLYAKQIKSIHPQAKVVGEIHTPLMLIDPDLDFASEYIDTYRVANEQISHSFETILPQGKLVPFPVSVDHIKFNLTKRMDLKEKVIFSIHSRFDEQQKDISYAIRLMDHFVNYDNIKNYFLYINGYGKYEKVYHQLIKLYHLENYVFINKQVPENNIYLSTARCETLGYSILEAFAQGKPIILYEGDDKSLIDIYGNMQSFAWLNKDLEKDATTIQAYLAASTVDKEKRYEHDLLEIKNIVKQEHYGKEYVQQVIDRPMTTQSANVAENLDVLDAIKQQHDLKDNNFVVSTYLKLKELPGIGKIVRSTRLKETVKKLLPDKSSVDNTQALLKGDLRNDFVFIETFHGKSFAGDPKYFALYLQNQFPNLHFFVSSANEMVDTEILNHQMIPVRIGGNRYIEKFRRSKLVVMNGNSLDKAGKVEGQIFLQTWHGFPLKKMVADLENPENRKKETDAFIPRMKKWDYLTVSSERNLEYLKSAFVLNENKELQILNFGAPRNEYLIKNKNDEMEKNKIIEKYFNHPIKDDIKYILFCPTWRNKRRHEVSNIDLVKLVSSLPESYEIIVKLHPLESQLSEYYNSLDTRIWSFPNEMSDIQELFLISDILITDYSSAMFDFSHLDKKILLLQEDEKEYQKTIGWYFDIFSEIKINKLVVNQSNFTKLIQTQESGLYNKAIRDLYLKEDSKDTNCSILKNIK